MTEKQAVRSVSGEHDDEILRAFKEYQDTLDRVNGDGSLEDEERESLEQAIAQANAMAVEAEIAGIQLRQVINASADGIMVVNTDGTIHFINAVLRTFLNMTQDEVMGQKCSHILRDFRCGGEDCPLVAVLRGESRHMEYDTEKRRADGTPVPFICTATPFADFDGEPAGIVVSLKNIEERKHLEDVLRKEKEQLEQYATIDTLTRLPNRRCFDQTISREWGRQRRNGGPLSLLLCDVDHLKLYNETCGRQRGDEFLCSIARTVEQQVRRSGDLVARYSGGTFAVILPGTDAAGARHVAERMRLSVERFGSDYGELPIAHSVSVSLGGSTRSPSDGEGVHMLVDQARECLRKAKTSGRTYVSGDSVGTGSSPWV